MARSARPLPLCERCGLVRVPTRYSVLCPDCSHAFKVEKALALVDDREPTVPGEPLAAVIVAIARREEREGNPFAIGELGSKDRRVAIVCARAGILPRQLNRWRYGENEVRLSVADLALTRLCLFWWEVWTEESVRLPLFTVRVYRWQWKVNRGKRRHCRVCMRSVPYGDRGPDLEALRRIEALMTGESVEAAA